MARISIRRLPKTGRSMPVRRDALLFVVVGTAVAVAVVVLVPQLVAGVAVIIEVAPHAIMEVAFAIIMEVALPAIMEVAVAVGMVVVVIAVAAVV